MKLLKNLLSIGVFMISLFSFTFSQDVTLSLDGGNLDYSSTADIAGFQFDHNGCVTGASGGDATANGFTVSASGSTVLAFSFTGSVVPAGRRNIVELSGDVTEDCLSEFIFSDSDGAHFLLDLEVLLMMAVMIVQMMVEIMNQHLFKILLVIIY